MVVLRWGEDDLRRSESCGDEKVWSSRSWSGDTVGGTSWSRTEDWRCLKGEDLAGAH